MMTTKKINLKEAAIRLLARRDHSVYELKTKLKLRGSFTEDEFTDLIKYLTQMGYLCDQDKLAQRLVDDWQKQGKSKRYVIQKLKSKKLSTSVALPNDEDELQAAMKFISKKISQPFKFLPLKEKARLSRQLLSRGFSASTVAKLSKSDIENL